MNATYTNRTAIQAFICAEGLMGIIVNIILLRFLWFTNRDRALNSYRICLSITAGHGIVFSLSTLMAAPIHHYAHGYFFTLFHGPFTIWLRSRCVDMILLQVHSLCFRSIWLIVPAPFFFQYLAICHPKISVRKRLLIIYGTISFLCIVALGFILDLLPTEAMRSEIIPIIAKLYPEIGPDEHLFFFGNTDQTKERGTIRLMAYLVPIVKSVLIVGWCVWRIDTALRRHVETIGAPAAQRHKHVSRVLLRQSCSLIFMFLPGLNFFAKSIAGASFGPAVTLFNNCSVYLTPTASAVFFLVHLNAASESRKPSALASTLIDT